MLGKRHRMWQEALPGMQWASLMGYMQMHSSARLHTSWSLTSACRSAPCSPALGWGQSGVSCGVLWVLGS